MMNFARPPHETKDLERTVQVVAQMKNRIKKEVEKRRTKEALTVFSSLNNIDSTPNARKQLINDLRIKEEALRIAEDIAIDLLENFT